MHVGKKIKKLIAESGKNADDVAVSLGVSRQTVYNWYHKESLESKYLLQLSNMFDVPITFFFDQKPELSEKKGDNESTSRIKELEEEKKRLYDILDRLSIAYSNLVSEYSGKQSGANEFLHLQLVPEKKAA